MFFRSLRLSFCLLLLLALRAQSQAKCRSAVARDTTPAGVSTTMSERCKSQTEPSKPNNVTSKLLSRPCLLLRRSSPRTISTDQLHTLLRFHLRPINQIVFLGPYSLKDERSHLRGSFTLRCFQRLSRPYIATQLCPWQNNWCTRGTSIPVLSY